MRKLHEVQEAHGNLNTREESKLVLNFKKKVAMVANEKQKVHAKKIANEPHLLGHWLNETAEKVFDPDLAFEFEKVSQFITKRASMNQESVEARARRIAFNVGLDITKGRKPYDDKNIGLFQLTNPRTGKVVGGSKFDMSANEVIEYCDMLNKRIFVHTHIPREQYQEDAERYWEIKQDTVDELYRKKLVKSYEDWAVSERKELNVHFGDGDVNAFYLSSYESERLYRTITHYQERVQKLEGFIRANNFCVENLPPEARH